MLQHGDVILSENERHHIKSNKPDMKGQISCFYLYELPKIVKFTETKQNSGYQKLGRGRNGELCLMGTVSVWDDEEVLEMDGGCTTMCMYNANELYT